MSNTTKMTISLVENSHKLHFLIWKGTFPYSDGFWYETQDQARTAGFNYAKRTNYIHNWGSVKEVDCDSI